MCSFTIINEDANLGGYEFGQTIDVQCKCLHHHDIINALSSSKLFTSFDIYDDVTETFSFLPPSSKVYKITSRIDKTTTLVCIRES